MRTRSPRGGRHSSFGVGPFGNRRNIPRGGNCTRVFSSMRRLECSRVVVPHHLSTSQLIISPAIGIRHSTLRFLQRIHLLQLPYPHHPVNAVITIEYWKCYGNSLVCRLLPFCSWTLRGKVVCEYTFCYFVCNFYCVSFWDVRNYEIYSIFIRTIVPCSYTIYFQN